MSMPSIIQGNHAEFYPSGQLSYQKRWQLLKNAKKTIHLVTFSLMKDGTTRKLVKLLSEKLDEGVEVKIILDHFVNLTTFVYKLLSQLESRGAILHKYNRFDQGWRIHWKEGRPFKQIMRNAKLKLKQHFHEKYMVIDGEEAILGGINWGDKYAFGGLKAKAWRDSDVYLKGPIVKEIQIQFLKDFYRYQLWDKTAAENPKARYFEFVRTIKWIDRPFIEKEFSPYLRENPPAGNIPIAYVAHKPYDDERLPMTDIYLELIASAKKQIFWGCHGIRPPRIFGQYFADAVKRGVEVILITCSKRSARSLMLNGLMGWMYQECTKHYKYLLENGIRIFEWQLKGAFHSKNFLADDKVCSIGSYNIARGSAYHHSESNVLIYDPGFIKQVREQFDLDLQSCKEVLLKDMSGKFPKENAFERLLHERDLMIRKDLIPDNIAAELSKGHYKRIFY